MTVLPLRNVLHREPLTTTGRVQTFARSLDSIFDDVADMTLDVERTGIVICSTTTCSTGPRTVR